MRHLAYLCVLAVIGLGVGTTTLGLVPVVQAALPPIEPPPEPPIDPPIDPLPDPDPTDPPPVCHSPEPTSLGLLLIGAGVVGMRALRNRHK